MRSYSDCASSGAMDISVRRRSPVSCVHDLQIRLWLGIGWWRRCDLRFYEIIGNNKLGLAQ